MKTSAQLIGLDNLAADYAYERDSEHGLYVDRSAIADKWVPTTCGYCSVGCGIEVGVQGRQSRRHPASTPPTPSIAASSAPRASPSTTRSTPETRANSSAAAQRTASSEGQLGRSARHNGRAFHRCAARNMAHSRSALSAPASWSPKSSTRSANWCSSASAPATTTATRRCAWPAPFPATRLPSAATDLRAHTRTSRRRTSSC